MATVRSVYAKALFEVAQAKGQAEGTLRDLKSFQEALGGHNVLFAVLGAPNVEAQKKLALLDDLAKALGLGALSARFLAVLSEKGRIADLSEIVADFESRVEASQGVTTGKVRSAVEISSEELSVLATALAKRVGGKVRLTQSVDPSLLGGVVATVAGKTFDASLRTQLERFRNELI